MLFSKFVFMNKRIVISGAPGTGKTSLIKELSNRGYICHPEISREIIADQIAAKGSITPWQDLNSFSKIVIEKRLNQFKQASNKIEFYDRGIIDALAYLLKDNIAIKQEWEAIAKKYRYFNKVFITPPWEDIYHTDEERKEDFSTAIEVHKFMIETYKLYDYQVITIPKASIDDRINFILNEIEQ